MITSIVCAIAKCVVDWARSLGQVVKRLLRPTRTLATASAGAARDLVRSRSELLAENAFLRQQVIVLRRSVKRPALGRLDRFVMVILARANSAWREALHLVQPDTLLRWHRDLFKIVWTRRSRPNTQPKRLAQVTID